MKLLELDFLFIYYYYFFFVCLFKNTLHIGESSFLKNLNYIAQKSINKVNQIYNYFNN